MVRSLRRRRGAHYEEDRRWGRACGGEKGGDGRAGEVWRWSGWGAEDAEEVTGETTRRGMGWGSEQVARYLAGGRRRRAGVEGRCGMV
eukprot:3860877-Rhodomonas_salina.1